MDRLSDHEILYSVLGGLQPGGTCLAWIAGLIACESLRLTQRFDEETSWDKRFFVYFSLLMSVTLAGRSSLDRERRLKLWLLFFLRYPETFYVHAKINQCRLFAAMLYHYCIGSYGNYHNLLHVTNVVRILILRAFCVGLWAWESQDLQGARRQSVHRGPGGGPVRGYCPRNPSGIHHTDFPNSCGSWVFWDMLICGALLTLLKACDLARSKAVRQMLVSNQDLSVSLLRIGDLSCLRFSKITWDQTGSDTFPVFSVYFAKQPFSQQYLILSRCIYAMPKELGLANTLRDIGKICVIGKLD
ncbi:hypothetical protein MJO29_003747 [Puccinia striiformis f. sp. tritici]|nr:hypothetical protein MJO29_003747 [Puccinia striiformis f. sp. tritici]